MGRPRPCEKVSSAGVPTANARSFTDADDALRHLQTVEAPVVVKADGLAAGKGVTVCQTLNEASDAVEDAGTLAVVQGVKHLLADIDPV